MDFDTAFARVVNVEKGYVNDPLDQGGETKYGISKRAYPMEDIPNMTIERAKALYLRDYWGAAGCDTVPDPLKFDLFDMVVNQGVHPAIRALQHSVGVAEDGILGSVTLAALAHANPARMVFRFDAARLVRYSEADDRQWLRFGRGWVRRVAANIDASTEAL